MSGQPAEPDIALSARLAALEKKAARRRGSPGWDGATSVFTAALLIAAGVLFLSFHAWAYYNDGQQQAAKTKAGRVEVALAAYHAVGSNPTADELPAEIQKLKAQLEKLKAEVVYQQAQADKSRAAADAATEKSGDYTLEERAARAKLVVSEMTAAAARMNAQAQAGWNDNTGPFTGMLRGLCQGNRYGELINCPIRYIAEVDATAAQRIAARCAPQASHAACTAKCVIPGCGNRPGCSMFPHDDEACVQSCNKRFPHEFSAACW
jgi:hypothetical protein